MTNPTATYLQIAALLLQEVKKPLSARDIVSIAMQRGILRSEGATPWQTMKSKLSTDILNRAEQSLFKRVSQGLFALREFDESEFFATRFKKKKLDEEIAVIAAEDLVRLIPKPGYFSRGIDRSLISNLMRPMLRRTAEEDFSVIQLVSVFVVHHAGRYLTHLRSARLPEQRLHGEYSLMLGGHLSTDDFSQLTLDLFDDASLSDCSYILRELSEELILNTDPIVSSCGYLYDISRDVSKQHLGLVYFVNLASDKFEIGERGFLMNSKFETPEQIRNRIERFENWSVVLLDNLERVNANAVSGESQ
jgi:predicted NUDIX family phosphoesterase